MNELGNTDYPVLRGIKRPLEQKLNELQTDYNELQEKFRMACWLLYEAAEELDRIDYPDKNYPQISIEQFLEENGR
jgi:hypothetical protein